MLRFKMHIINAQKTDALCCNRLVNAFTITSCSRQSKCQKNRLWNKGRYMSTLLRRKNSFSKTTLTEYGEEKPHPTHVYFNTSKWLLHWHNLSRKFTNMWSIATGQKQPITIISVQISRSFNCPDRYSLSWRIELSRTEAGFKRAIYADRPVSVPSQQNLCLRLHRLGPS